MEAREALHRRGKKVGRPIYNWYEPRRCSVDGIALTDSELFTEAWGETLAEEIIQEWPESKSIPPACYECDRLWHEYGLATGRYIKIFSELAASRQDATSRLAALLEYASESRQRIRQCVIEHGTGHASQAA